MNKPLEVLSEGRSIIVGGGPNNDDIAEFFYADEATVKTTREEALAHAHRFAASERMLAALERMIKPWADATDEDLKTAGGIPGILAREIEDVIEARAVIKAAKGE